MVPRWLAVFCAAGVSMYAFACSSQDTPDTAAFWRSFAPPEAYGAPPLSGELTVERLTEADAVVIVGTVLDVVPATLTDRAAADSGEISPEEYGRRYADAIVRVDETLHGRPVASEIRVGNRCLDKVRRRVQNETLGHRGRRDDPLYRIRKLLLTGQERLNEKGKERVLLGPRAGDPHDEVLGAWLAKESVRDCQIG